MTLNLIDLFHGFLRTERKPRYLRLTAYRRTCAIRACALCVLLVFTIGMNAFSAKQVRLYLEKESLKDYYAHHHETEAVVYDYVSTHKDGIYVFDWTLMSTYDPFPGLKTGDLNNLFCWGGARQFTYAYNDQLVLNGLDDLYSDAFLNDGVYLLTGSGDSIVQLLLFLNEEYGAKYAAFVDTLDKGVNVIRFLPEVSDAELLTQNYEQIWICEGQAVNPYTPVS